MAKDPDLAVDHIRQQHLATLIEAPRHSTSTREQSLWSYESLSVLLLLGIMNSAAILSAQGWRGTGHSLHKTDDSIGLAKPLLLNRKDNTHGLGQKQHFTSDQWWMNAFDEQLNGLDTSKEGTVTQNVKHGKLNSIEQVASLGKWALYPSFVSGGLLQGTISLSTTTTTSTTSVSTTDSEDSDADEPTTAADQTRSSKRDKTGKKRKSGDVAEKKESKEDKKRRKAEKRQRKEQRALDRTARRQRKASRSKTSDSADDSTEEKRRRRARKEEKRRKRKQAEAAA